MKTGRLLIAHEAPLTGGFAAEISSTVQVMTEILSSCICNQFHMNILISVFMFSLTHILMWEAQPSFCICNIKSYSDWPTWLKLNLFYAA